MTIDNTAAIRAWASTRADKLHEDFKRSSYPQAYMPILLARIEELRMVITLCDGLKQNQQDDGKRNAGYEINSKHPKTLKKHAGIATA